MAFSRNFGYWTQGNSECFFLLPTKPASQREDWYTHHPYIAEFWCTLSSILCCCIAAYFQTWPLCIAFFLSSLSHALPFTWLNILDKIGALFACLHLGYPLPFHLCFNPILARILISLALMVWADKEHPSTFFHVSWHFIACVSYLYCKHAF